MLWLKYLLFERVVVGYRGMGTPIKRPLQKKLRGDAGLDDDVHITGVNCAGPSQSVSLSTIESG